MTARARPWDRSGRPCGTTFRRRRECRAARRPAPWPTPRRAEASTSPPARIAGRRMRPGDPTCSPRPSYSAERSPATAARSSDTSSGELNTEKVARVVPVDSERDHGPAVDGHRRAVDRDPCSSSEALERLAGERLLVLADSFHADLLQIFDRRGKPYRLGDRWRARLEAPGKVVPLGAIDPDLLDHLAAAAPGLQTIEHRSPAVHDADPGGPEHLVGREHVKVTSQ